MAEFTSEADRLAWGRCMNGQPNVKDAFIGGMEWGRENPLSETARQSADSKAPAGRAIQEIQDKIDAGQFKPGDVVQLKSGGVSMTVISTIGIEGSRRPDPLIHVSWVDSTGKPWEQDLPEAACKMAELPYRVWTYQAGNMHELEAMKKAAISMTDKQHVFVPRVGGYSPMIDVAEKEELDRILKSMDSHRVDAKTPTAAT